MDEELNPDDEDVKSVLAQESSELLHILSRQSPSVLKSLYRMMPPESVRQDEPASANIAAMLKHFSEASAAECCNFLHRVCMICEDIPLHLESKLVSVAGYVSSGCGNLTDGQKSSTPGSEELLSKRPRIDYWEEYIQAVTGFLQRRWRRQSEGLVKDVQPEKVWVSIRTANRGRERPDQTPGSTDRGSRTPEPDVDYGCLESRLTLENFLQECAGKVTVLGGKAGSGKTLLMGCLGQQWANGLGPIPSSSLFVLLEFRQLNLLSSPLSLSALLFQHYLPPPHGDHQAKQAVVDYLLSNPEQSCWVLDGYDEFHRKLYRQTEPLDLNEAAPVADLISGLLTRQILPGSTVLITCRVRDITDLDGLTESVGELLPWDHQEIKEYVDNFFGGKDGSLGTEAAELLLSSRHLLSMSSLPALCNFCCVFLKNLLLEGRDSEKMQLLEDKGRTNSQETKDKEAQGSEGRDGDGRNRGKATSVDASNSRSGLSSTAAQIPTTLTQVYLAAVAAFLSRGGRNNQTKTSSWSNSVVCTLSQYPPELCELSRLAWRGLEENKILFVEEEVPADVLEFSVETGLLSQVEFRRPDGTLVDAYCFIHLTVQEFLAALRIMTSNDLDGAQLKRRFSLKSRWTTKSDQKTAFTDSLYLHVCGLASPQCTAALVLVAKASGLKGVQSWVEKRQAYVVKLLDALCHSNSLTGPKILQLCRCVQESQNQELAQQVVSSRPTLELRNFWLLPSDIDALAFVVNAGGDNGVGLDFGSCSMELECLDVLSRCRYIHSLSFRRRKYGDKFAEKLSTILPEFTTLKKLEFCGASLTAAGAASLASGLQNCPTIMEINFSDNNLQDEGVGHIVEVFTDLQNLVSVTLGRNNTSLKTVNYLVEKISCLNIQRVHADENKELIITFFPDSNISSCKPDPQPAVSLLNQKWSESDVKQLSESLVRCPGLSVLDLSGGQWDEETIKTLTEFVPKFNISEKIILNGSCSSVECLELLTALLSECPPVVEVHIRLQNPVRVSVVFPEGREKPAGPASKTLCLSSCNLLPSDLERVWRSLGASPGLTVLDLSCNRLGDKGLKKLLDVLPRLTKVQEVNFSDNSVSMDGAAMMAGALCSNSSLTDVQIRDKDQVILQFSPDTSDDNLQIKTFRINNRSLLPSDVNKICRRLFQCGSRLELEFSHCSLAERAIENLLKALPKMSSLQRLNVSSSITSTADALILISCLVDSQRVTSVELRAQSESFIHFDGVKSEPVNCSLTGFCLNGDNVALMKRLLEVLQQNQNQNPNQQLSYLNLSGNQLEDEGVKRLVDSLPGLQITSYINLSDNSLTQTGLLDVAGTLGSCVKVSAVEISLGEDQRCLIWFRQKRRTLRISRSRLEPLHLLRLAEIVSNCPALTKLELKNNMLQLEGIENFVKLLACSDKLSVSIEESWIRAEEAVRLVCRCLQLRNIQTIRIHQTTLHLALKKDTELSSISLVDCSVDGNQLTSLKSFLVGRPLLTELDVSSNRLDVDGAEFLSSLLPSLPGLTSLSIRTKESTVSVVEELSQVLLLSTSIQHLNLSGHLISDAAAQSLTDMFPRLRSLNLSRCVWSQDGGLRLFKALSHCEHLEELCLDAAAQLNENIWTCLTEALKNMTSIRSLRLNEIVRTSEQADVLLDLLAGLEGLRHVENIELGGWRMNDRGIEQLTEVLPEWKELRKLRLSENLVSDSSGGKLLDALRSCSLLEELHLCRNGLGDLTASRMALVLPSMTRLTVLDISENRLGHEGSVSLSRAMRSLKNLQKIHLTSVGTPELSAVAASLSHCSLIQDVGLGWNNCGDDVVLELAKVLPVCHELTRIDLECNCVSAAGVEVLIKALKSCPALQIIRLWRNSLSVSEAQRFGLRDRRLNFSSIVA